LKIRGIIIIAGIFAIIIAVIILPNNSIVVRPGIEDNPQIHTDTSLDVSSRADEPMIKENDVIASGNQDGPQILTDTSLDVSSSADEPIVTESIVISSVQEEVPFYIDENGTKHYTIVSVDRPDMHGDQSP